MNTIMKRVRLKGDTEVVYRVPEELAQRLVKEAGYVYATRTEWKVAGRRMTYPSSVVGITKVIAALSEEVVD